MIANMINVNNETGRQIEQDKLNKWIQKCSQNILLWNKTITRKGIRSNIMKHLREESGLLTNVSICMYNWETKRPTIKKVWTNKSKLKGAIMIYWVPQGQKVDEEYNREVVIKLGKRTFKQNRNSSRFKYIPVLKNPPYSPHLSPWDFCLHNFPTLSFLL